VAAWRPPHLRADLAHSNPGLVQRIEERIQAERCEADADKGGRQAVKPASRPHLRVRSPAGETRRGADKLAVNAARVFVDSVPFVRQLSLDRKHQREVQRRLRAQERRNELEAQRCVCRRCACSASARAQLVTPRRRQHQEEEAERLERLARVRAEAALAAETASMRVFWIKLLHLAPVTNYLTAVRATF